jgi:hypothetical protein
MLMVRLIPVHCNNFFLWYFFPLSGVACTAEAMKSGIDLGEMNKLLLQKVEELTLYTISLEKRLRQVEIK